MKAMWIQSPCYFFRLHTAARKLGELYDNALAPHGIRVTQYSLLSHVRRLGPVSRVNLGAAMALDRTTLVRNCAVLEKMGCVEALGDVPANSKNRRYTLTAKGMELQKQASHSWQKVQKTVDAALTAEEVCVLETILQKLNALQD